MSSEQYCDYCNKLINKQQQGYALKIEMFALAGPLEFSAQDLKKDYQSELQELIEKLESLDVDEAEDQVHESYQFVLCAACRHDLHKRLKHRRNVGRG